MIFVYNFLALTAGSKVLENAWVKREAGENPERSRHCVREYIFIITEYFWEEKMYVDRSQETCLFLVILICGTRIFIMMKLKESSGLLRFYV